MSANSRRSLVWGICLIALAWNVWNVGIASGYIDSVKKLGAQDEAVYTREAIHMATRGDWLTMTYLDRYVLFKPPLLMWLSAVCAKVFGIAALPLRMPSLLAGALVCMLIFAMSKRAGWVAIALLVSDRLFHTLARVNMTDMILCACVTGAFYFFWRDTRLETRASFWGFSIACGLAILAKSIAGLLPFVVVLLFGFIIRGPRFWRLVQTGLIALGIALPWHIYQLTAHYQWFLAEYLGVQLLAFGGKPPQTSQENQIVFYLSRMWLSDPVIAVAAALAVPAWIVALRRRAETLPVLLFAWVAVFGAALLIFQYRSVQYMLPLIPALALLAAEYGPWMDRRAAVALLCAVFVAKAMWPDRLWGLSFASGNTVVFAEPLSKYCEERRPNDLIVIESGDEFYSSVIPITHVRYGVIDPTGYYFQLEPHLQYLGITQTPAEFVAVRDDVYARRLKEWGMASAKSIGTTIFARKAEEFQLLIAGRPGSDFLLPRAFVPAGIENTHEVRTAPMDRVFLISKQPTKDVWEGPRWSCRM